MDPAVTQVAPSVIGALLERGSLGILVIVEAIAIVALWRWGRATNDARIAEAIKFVQVAEQMGTAMNRVADNLTRR